MPCPLVCFKLLLWRSLECLVKEYRFSFLFSCTHCYLKCFLCLKVILGLLDFCLKGLLIKVWPKKSMVFPVLWFASNNYPKGFSCWSRIKRFLTDFQFCCLHNLLLFHITYNLRYPLDIVSFPYENPCRVDEQLNPFMTP